MEIAEQRDIRQVFQCVKDNTMLFVEVQLLCYKGCEEIKS